MRTNRADSSGASCSCCSLISFGLAIFYLWANFHLSNPKCSIQDFYLPALNNSLNSADNSILYFQLKLKNSNKLKGIYYDPVNVTLVNKSNTTTYIGNYVVPKFYQGFRKTAEKDGSVDVDKEVVKSAVFDNGTAIFGVDLATAVRFKGFFWTTKRHRIRVGADVEVNDQAYESSNGSHYVLLTHGELKQQQIRGYECDHLGNYSVLGLSASSSF
ncbi:protein NDR1-like [Mangifera indica]|uniref:protein NDR1-like n=1 Tax=Mangifera indica TaxID=29780 RepID=UPI001CF93D6D|nr:protein NDR1-like [Mangifera indica]